MVREVISKPEDGYTSEILEGYVGERAIIYHISEEKSSAGAVSGRIDSARNYVLWNGVGQDALRITEVDGMIRLGTASMFNKDTRVEDNEFRNHVFHNKDNQETSHTEI